MPKHCRNTLILALLAAGLAGGGWYFFGEASDQAPTGRMAKIATAPAENEPPDTAIYETEAATADECSSYEDFDTGQGVCYFSCATAAECDAINQSIEDELATWNADTNTATNAKQEQAIAANSATLVAEYAITNGEKLKLQRGTDSKESQAIWQGVAGVLPDAVTSEYLETFQIFNDSADDTLAFVDDEDGNGLWRLAISQKDYEESSAKERSITTIHELAHIITLNSTQFLAPTADCPNYETDEGCTTATAYLNQFVKNFWQNSGDKRETAFITEYASTNPEEDIAESFAYFVVGAGNTNPSQIKNQKLHFFNRFPELAQMRQEIRNGLFASVIRARQKTTAGQ